MYIRAIDGLQEFQGLLITSKTYSKSKQSKQNEAVLFDATDSDGLFYCLSLLVENQSVYHNKTSDMCNAVCFQYDSLKAAGGKKEENKKQPLGLFTVKPHAAVSGPGRLSATPRPTKMPHWPHQPTETRRFRLQTKLQEKKENFMGRHLLPPTRPDSQTAPVACRALMGSW